LFLFVQLIKFRLIDNLAKQEVDDGRSGPEKAIPETNHEQENQVQPQPNQSGSPSIVKVEASLSLVVGCWVDRDIIEDHPLTAFYGPLLQPDCIG
jgi:hypothetical protein